MANAPSRSSRPSSWRTKLYILAALAGILAATVVVIVVSAILSPAEIHFSITDASNSDWANGEKQLHLALAADNTSPRAGVRYRDFIVYLQYTKAADPTVYKIPADDIREPLCNCQPPGSRATINVTANIGGELWSSDFSRSENGSTAGASQIGVRVTTVVQFKYGRAYTRPYSVRVLCDPVDYFSGSRPSLPSYCTA